MVHEASLHENNIFVTLTYNNENLPQDRSLNLTHFQHFMKRLRKQKGAGIRFYHCGEYSPIKLRPHYHAILFNLQFDDLVEFALDGENITYTSQELEKIWGKGFCTVGDVNVSTARYVAGYIQKKITGERSKDHYSRVNTHSGEIWEVLPEYATMSRRPGIGIGWFTKFQTDCYPSDFITHEGAMHPIPRAYDRQLEKEFKNLPLLNKVKSRRKQRANSPESKAEQTTERLRVKERLEFLEAQKHERKEHD